MDLGHIAFEAHATEMGWRRGWLERTEGCRVAWRSVADAVLLVARADRTVGLATHSLDPCHGQCPTSGVYLWKPERIHGGCMRGNWGDEDGAVLPAD
jgi:hypothetical protein